MIGSEAERLIRHRGTENGPHMVYMAAVENLGQWMKV